jgi:hypothetical protein
VSTRSARRLVGCAWALTVALLVAAHAFRALLDDVAGPADITLSFLLVVTALALTYSTVGGVVATRRPANPVGWVFLGSALSAALILASAAYAETAVPVPAPGPVPGGALAAWVAGALAFPTVALISVVLLLYPDGRLPSRRWRFAAWITAAATVTSAIGAFAPGVIEEEETPIENPLGIGGTAGEVVATLRPVAGILLQLSLVLGLASMFVRFRRSRGDERLQLKWFVLAIASTAGFVALSAVASAVAPAADGANAVEEACFYLALLGVAALPVTAAVAILKYRLYDIDVVINRALVYGALTATLAASYLGGVLLLQLVLSPLTESSNLAIAGSTLAVAALFRPARRRIQELVDRRFYRRRYDAARTLERFGGRLRNEVDLDALGVELRTVVSETVQPTHVSLWLRSS